VNPGKAHLVRIFLLLAVLASLAAGQTAHDAFERGSTLYRAARYADAAKEYESIVQQGYASAELYYNLGNTYYRLGQLGPAILSYERAFRLAPNDPDIQQNLKLANQRTLDRIEPVPELFLITWLREAATLFSLSTTTAVLLVLWTLLFLSLAAAYLVLPAGIKRLARWVTLFSAVFVFLFAILLAMQIYESSSRNDAIVMSPVVTAKNSPDSQSSDAFVIHEGLKVTLSDRVGDWVKITLADGKVGWIQADQCERV
jgi:tetratricopeptide (TPR) repeat protein